MPSPIHCSSSTRLMTDEALIPLHRLNNSIIHSYEYITGIKTRQSESVRKLESVQQVWNGPDGLPVVIATPSKHWKKTMLTEWYYQKHPLPAKCTKYFCLKVTTQEDYKNSCCSRQRFNSMHKCNLSFFKPYLLLHNYEWS